VQRRGVSNAPVTADEGSGEGEEQLPSEAEAKRQVYGFLELSGCVGQIGVRQEPSIQ
jgi:hypothetical protein